MGLSNSPRVSRKGLIGKRFSGPLVRYLYGVYLQSCQRRGMTLELSDDLFETLITSSCFYCGLPPYNETKNRGPRMKYTGIDRLDNALPYTESNTVPCCKVCNSMKSQLAPGEFLAHCQRIARHAFSEDVGVLLRNFRRAG